MYSTIFKGKFFISLSTQLSYFKTFLSKGSSLTSKKKNSPVFMYNTEDFNQYVLHGWMFYTYHVKHNLSTNPIFFYPWCMKPFSQSSSIQARKVHLVQWQVIYYLFYWWHSLMKNECNKTSCCYGIDEWDEWTSPQLTLSSKASYL